MPDYGEDCCKLFAVVVYERSLFMSLLRFDDVSLAFGDQKILTHAHFSLEANERVCLIGRNGAGKSTILRLIVGEQQPDSGDIQHMRDIRISKLDQQLPAALDRTVEQVVMEGLAYQQQLIQHFEQMSSQVLDARELKELHAIQQQIDAGGGWHLEQKVETTITQLQLPMGKTLAQLSGGWRRRVALGQALVSKPDILLLDEPTNHLDINTIEWLEHVVRSYPGSIIFITHDRSFLQKLATRILEIDRSQLISWPGDYQNYLTLKAKANAEEDIKNSLFDKKLAGEEAWIRQGVKARRTRNEGRVRALQAMREEYGQRVKRQGKTRFLISAGEQSGRKVIEARSITHGYSLADDCHSDDSNDKLIRDFKLKIMRGDRIGLIGNNGVGKSTLLKILLGEIEPNQGSIKLGTGLHIGYFDQTHRELALDKSVAHNVGDGKEYITLNGKHRHVIGYLRSFLFTPQRAMMPVSALSGGERNRVLLAKLFARETNFLILDEPTNDLDVETLEALETQLINYSGTLIVVSHDRAFLDNVVTSVLVFEADGHIGHYVGGYSDWLRQGKALKETESPDNSPPKNAAAAGTQTPPATKPKKLSYKLQRELEQLPGDIEQLEKAIAKLEQQMSAPDFYQQQYAITQPMMDELTDKQAELDRLLERWVQLEQ